jgi:hypothetical protein
MALNSSGPISLGGSTSGQSIALELGLGTTTQISLNQTDVRTLAGVASGQIVMPTNFYGKSSNSYWGVQVNYGAGSFNTYPAQGVYTVGSNVLAFEKGAGTGAFAVYIFNSSGVLQSVKRYNISTLFAPLYRYAASDGTYLYMPVLDTSGTNNHAIFLKVDSSGAVVSSYYYVMPGKTGDTVNMLSADSSGNVYGFSDNGYQGYVVKANSSGSYQYITAAAPNSNTASLGSYTSGSVSPNGSYMYALGYVVVSSVNNLALFALNPSTGAATSAYRYVYATGTQFQTAYATGTPFVATSNANNVYIFSAGGSGSVSSGVVAKFSGGTLSSPTWARKLTRTGSTVSSVYASGIAIDSSENVYVLLTCPSGQSSPATIYPTLWLVKYNSSGVLQWQTAINIYNSVYGFSGWSANPNISIDSNNNLFLSIAVADLDTILKLNLPLPASGELLLGTTSAYHGVQFYFATGTLTDASYSFYSTTAITGLSATALTLTTGTFSASATTATLPSSNTTAFTYSSGWGSATYSIPGTYSWVAPAGVTRVSVVAIGGGGKGSFVCSPTSYTSGGGGGGGLGYKNNIAVNPGCSYTVVVGRGGAGANGCCLSQDSYFINTSTVKGGAGSCGNRTNSRAAPGGTYTGDGGGNGGAGGQASGNYASGGGGAGGYSGTGGAGGKAGLTGPYCGAAGSGGAAGGGGGNSQQGYPVGYAGHSGGGVWVAGQFCSGVAYSGLGQSGSLGYSTCCSYSGYAGNGGGGGAGYYCSGGCCGPSSGVTNLSGGKGIVRIIWPGCARSFPSTNTGSV